MDSPLTIVCLARHGETVWSITEKHTGRTDIALSEQSKQNARLLRETFGRVLSSPLKRMTRTCGVLATRLLNHEASMGSHLLLSSASLSLLGYEHDLLHPVIRLWNDTQPFALAQKET
jgi:broad specificity phosphatase PhoE